MTTDSLRSAVEAYDRQRNDPRVLRRLARPAIAVRRICLACGSAFEPRLAPLKWGCQACGGKLVEVVS